jgi:hypothetical protein
MRNFIGSCPLRGTGKRRESAVKGTASLECGVDCVAFAGLRSGVIMADDALDSVLSQRPSRGGKRVDLCQALDAPAILLILIVARDTLALETLTTRLRSSFRPRFW